MVLVKSKEDPEVLGKVHQLLMNLIWNEKRQVNEQKTDEETHNHIEILTLVIRFFVI